MLTKEEAEKRVARGAAHLDQVRPGWFHRIDVGTLTLHDPCGCIVGQLCGSFYQISQIGLKRFPDAVDYGFEQFSDPTDPSELRLTNAQLRANHQPLQDAWIAAIADRKLAGDGAHPVEKFAVDPVVASAGKA